MFNDSVEYVLGKLYSSAASSDSSSLFWAVRKICSICLHFNFGQVVGDCSGVAEVIKGTAPVAFLICWACLGQTATQL